MTRRRDVAARDDPALRLLAECFAPVCTLVGKTWKLHLEKIIHADPEENLRIISDSVAYLRAEGKRVVYDAEHFFDGYRDDADYALRCLQAALEAGAENVALCDTNGASLQPHVAAATARVVERVRRRAGRHPHPQRRRVRGRELDRRGRGGRDGGAGHHERRRRALREREPGLDPALASDEARLPLRHRRAARDPDRGRALRRRGLQPDAGPQPALCRPQRLRPRRRHACGRRARRRANLRAHRPRGRGQPARAAGLGALRQGNGARARRGRGPRPGREGGHARGRARSRSSSTAATTSRPPTPPSSCFCARRRASTSRCSGSRASA